MEVGNSSLQGATYARARMNQRAIDDPALQTLLDHGLAQHDDEAAGGS